MHASGEMSLTSSVPETFEYFLASSQILQLREESAHLHQHTSTPTRQHAAVLAHLSTRRKPTLAHYRPPPALTSAMATPTHLGQKVKMKRATAAPLGSSVRISGCAQNLPSAGGAGCVAAADRDRSGAGNVTHQ